MIPVVQRRSSYRRELLYNGSKHRPHPVVSLRLHNDTGLTLERGPVTVVEDGQYRGEAMLPFTKAGGEIVLAFAVELGVRVLEEQRLENTMAGLELEDIYLQVQEYETKWVTYTLINTTNTEQVITLEQARWRDAELTQTRKPDEETGEHRRWRVDCPPGRQTSFKVGERLLTARRESIVGQDVEALSAYLETRFLDRDSRRKLEAVLRLRRRMGEIDREVEALRTEQQELGSKQERLRKNLTINATNEEEQEIRRRSAEEFRRTQDRDNAIEADLSRLKTEREQAERDLHAELAQF
jgi:hypothetical protein